MRLRMLPSPLRFSTGRSVHGCYEIIFVSAPIFAPSLCRFTLISSFNDGRGPGAFTELVEHLFAPRFWL